MQCSQCAVVFLCLFILGRYDISKPHKYPVARRPSPHTCARGGVDDGNLERIMGLGWGNNDNGISGNGGCGKGFDLGFSYMGLSGFALQLAWSGMTQGMRQDAMNQYGDYVRNQERRADETARANTFASLLANLSRKATVGSDGGMVGDFDDYLKKYGDVQNPAPRGKKKKKSSTISDINSVYGNTTFIPGTSLSLVANTKFFRGLSMGGIEFRAATYSAQKAMLNPVIGKILGKSITTMNVIKGGGNVLGGVGLFLTAYDIKENGLNMSNGLDATFGVFSFVPGVGWVVGGAYFIGNAVSTELTGKNIGQHVDDFVAPQNLDNMADDIIHFYSN